MQIAPSQAGPAQVRPPQPPRGRRTPRKAGASAGKHAVLIVLSAMFALPLVWMVGTSFKTAQQALTLPVVWWPRPFLWSNYPQPAGDPACDCPLPRGDNESSADLPGPRAG
jgi:hypothetical protein